MLPACPQKGPRLTAIRSDLGDLLSASLEENRRPPLHMFIYSVRPLPTVHGMAFTALGLCHGLSPCNHLRTSIRGRFGNFRAEDSSFHRSHAEWP